MCKKSKFFLRKHRKNLHKLTEAVKIVLEEHDKMRGKEAPLNTLEDTKQSPDSKCPHHHETEQGSGLMHIPNNSSCLLKPVELEKFQKEIKGIRKNISKIENKITPLRPEPKYGNITQMDVNKVQKLILRSRLKINFLTNQDGSNLEGSKILNQDLFSVKKGSYSKSSAQRSTVKFNFPDFYKDDEHSNSKNKSRGNSRGSYRVRFAAESPPMSKDDRTLSDIELEYQRRVNKALKSLKKKNQNRDLIL
mmetsp:Transcript_15663/g.15464  ORF Transcript_15663/g.15464 Transcript_15663/m.15464 type:complete len:249 (-) Transcript_15663:7-753(-)